jgi:alpha-beta hydrolase superfamily lysophospholipase
MIEAALRFVATDGKSIAYYRDVPKSPAKAIVLIGHGMNDHKERFSHLSGAMADVGFVCYVPDLRGHGQTDTGVDRGYLGDSNGFERIVQDLTEIGDFAVQQEGGLPLFYFGHSFGALLGMALAGVYGKSLEGVILSAPPEKPAPLLDFFGGIAVRLGITFKGARAAAKLPRSMTFGAYEKTVSGARTGSDWISRDHTVVDAYVADPDCNFVCSYGFYRDLMQGVHKVYAPAFLSSVPTSLSVLLMAGSNDPVIGQKEGFEKLSAQFKRLGLVDFESKCYEGGRHESINELNKDEVLSDITDWLTRHVS